MVTSTQTHPLWAKLQAPDKGREGSQQVGFTFLFLQLVTSGNLFDPGTEEPGGLPSMELQS